MKAINLVKDAAMAALTIICLMAIGLIVGSPKEFIRDE